MGNNDHQIPRGELMPNVGFKHSEESKRKIAEGNTGKFVSIETRKRMAESRRGKTVSAETREKIGNVHRGGKLTVEHKDNISKGLKGRSLSDSHKVNISKGAKKRPPKSPETRAKIAEAMRKSHRERKALTSDSHIQTQYQRLRSQGIDIGTIANLFKMTVTELFDIIY